MASENSPIAVAISLSCWGAPSLIDEAQTFIEERRTARAGTQTSRAITAKIDTPPQRGADFYLPDGSEPSTPFT